VEKYLPEFKGQMVAGPDGTETRQAPRHPITVREIMSHTSGIVLASEKTLERAVCAGDRRLDLHSFRAGLCEKVWPMTGQQHGVILTTPHVRDIPIR